MLAIISLRGIFIPKHPFHRKKKRLTIRKNAIVQTWFPFFNFSLRVRFKKEIIKIYFIVMCETNDLNNCLLLEIRNRVCNVYKVLSHLVLLFGFSLSIQVAELSTSCHDTVTSGVWKLQPCQLVSRALYTCLLCYSLRRNSPSIKLFGPQNAHVTFLIT